MKIPKIIHQTWKSSLKLQMQVIIKQIVQQTTSFL
jgi:hypothetical protein